MKLTFHPERTEPIRYAVSLDTWYHLEPYWRIDRR
jgi:hypothetical protein